MKLAPKNISVAFAGLGDHAVRAHLAHLAKMPDVAIVGAFDPSTEQLQSVERSMNISLKKYSSMEDLCADPEVDAVLISSPDRFHTSQLLQAVQGGKHVFCEKPLSSNAAEFESLKKAFDTAHEKGLTITSCHPRRFDPPYLWVKDNLSDLQARFGDIIRVDLDFSYHKPDPEKQHLHGGSMLLDHANHEIDYIHFLLGHTPLQAWKQLDIHDRYHLTAQREDGIVINFMGTRRLNESIYPETIDIRFERGWLHVDTYNVNGSFFQNHDTGMREIVLSGKTDYEKRFSGINRNWIDSIRQPEKAYLSQQDMLANTEMSIAFAKNDRWSYRPSATRV
jgi:predicted dehydrogenase